MLTGYYLGIYYNGGMSFYLIVSYLACVLVCVHAESVRLCVSLMYEYVAMTFCFIESK